MRKSYWICSSTNTWFKPPTPIQFSNHIRITLWKFTKKSLEVFLPVIDFLTFLWYLLYMGTKDYLDKTLPVLPSDRRQLKQELEWMVFKKEKTTLKPKK